MKKYIHKKLNERSSIDGAVLLGIGVCFLIFKPLAVLCAYGAIAYGAYTIWRKG